MAEKDDVGLSLSLSLGVNQHSFKVNHMHHPQQQQLQHQPQPVPINHNKTLFADLFQLPGTRFFFFQCFLISCFYILLAFSPKNSIYSRHRFFVSLSLHTYKLCFFFWKKKKLKKIFSSSDYLKLKPCW